MRLINVYTMQLETFPGQELPTKYAILSHTWAKDEEEVRFDEIGTRDLAWQKKSGGGKIKTFCELTKRLDIKYAWVDTCCIDTSSNAEVNETINAMFRLYHDATVCFVHLQGASKMEASDMTDLLSRSRWFTRGWTLQELIAPPKVWFYDQNWRIIGEKSSDLLLSSLSRITRIYRDVLQDGSRVSKVSIGTRLSWAAGRQTSRIEDIAYSLLGICGVTMPIFYGEGISAFHRLLREIIRSSNDTSILAWISPPGYQEARSFLADSPDEFLLFSKASLFLQPAHWMCQYSLTNDGCRTDAGPLRKISGSNLDFDLGTNSHTKMSVHTYGILVRETKGNFVIMRLQKLFILNGKVYNRSRVFHLEIYGRALDSLENPGISLSDLEAGNVLDGFENRVPQKDGGNIVMDNIRHAVFGASHMIPQNIGTYPFSSEFYGQVGPGEDTSCLDTSQYDSNNNIIASCTSSFSSWDSEEADARRQLREDFSKSLSYLVENSTRIFFQTLVHEVGSPRQVLHVNMATSNSKKVTALTATLTTQYQSDTGCIVHVSGLDICGEYASGRTSSQHLASFSCHFYKKDPKRYEDCRLKGTPDMTSLCQHILKKHRQPPYCPTCYKTFGLVSERDRHVVLRACAPMAFGRVEGISEHQASVIRETCKSHAGEEQIWYSLWKTIFPESQEPQSAKADNSIDVLCFTFRSFWRTTGKLVLAFLLKEKGMLDWEYPNEESNLASIHSLVLTDVIKNFVNFGNEILVELQNPIQSAVASSTELTAEEEMPVDPYHGMAASSADTTLSGIEMVKHEPTYLPQGSATESSALTDQNCPSMQEWLAFNETEDENCTNASSLSTENAYQQCRDARPSRLGWTWRQPGNTETPNRVYTSSPTAGVLPCELAGAFGCERQFELTNLELWIDHHRYQHFGGILPEQCSCWFCDETFSGSDRGINFATRMEHIAEHFRTGEYGGDRFHNDRHMAKHLKLLWPWVLSPDLGTDSQSAAQISCRNHRGDDNDRAALPGCQLPNDSSRGRLDAPVAIHSQQKNIDQDFHDLKKSGQFPNTS